MISRFLVLRHIQLSAVISSFIISIIMIMSLSLLLSGHDMKLISKSNEVAVCRSLMNGCDICRTLREVRACRKICKMYINSWCISNSDDLVCDCESAYVFFSHICHVYYIPFVKIRRGFTLGRGELPPPNLSFPLKSLFTAAVCS